MNIDLEKYLSVYAANHLKPYMDSDEVVKRAVENLCLRIEEQEEIIANISEGVLDCFVKLAEC